jgi:hypothetical protein
MAMGDTIMSIISFIVVVLGLLMIEVVFGPIINAFANIATTVDTGGDPFWVSQVLPNFSWFHNVPLLIIIAVAIWVVLRIIFNVQYSRQDNMGGYR